MAFNKKVIIDTPIMIDLLRGIEKSKNWLDGIETENILISVVTVAELIAGCRNKNEQKKVDRELKEYEVIYLSSKCCKLGLEWYKNFHLSYGVGFLDCLIAATAYEKNVPIATLNDKLFLSNTILYSAYISFLTTIIKCLQYKTFKSLSNPSVVHFSNV